MPGGRPNILLIFTDQQRADTIGSLGNPVIRTPNLDRLRSEGTAFTSAYTPSPVCVPARCSMIYGQYPQRTGCYDNAFPMPEDGRESFVDALTRAGYRTHGIGKCHYTPDPHAMRGFQTRETQEEIVGAPEADDYLKFLHAAGFGGIADPHGVRGEMYYVPQPAQMPAEYHPTQWVGDRAVAFIGRESRSGNPWYLFCSFVHPHPPFCPPSPWHKLYRAPLMPLPKLPPGSESLRMYVNRHQNRYKYRDQGLDMNLLRCMKAYYYATISFIDFQVGRILEALAQAGVLDETMVIFTSDHGELLGDYGCFGKRSVHDSCAKVPLLVRLPGRFPGGAIRNDPVSLVDIAPTILAAAGTSISTHAPDGLDLADVASGRSRRERVYMQYQREGLAVYAAVSARWKYAWSAPDGREYLFDRIGDPEETRDRSGLPFCRQAQEEMRRALIGFLREAGETCALDGNIWRKFPKQEVPDNPDAGLIAQDHPWARARLPGYSGEPD
ncbi:MAG: sulfatase-like hydrolase/transferase [Planctomycetota bacterium]|nr:sulfatase-like hydrolase/transferase [Planctomycetota bacterium]